MNGLAGTGPRLSNRLDDLDSGGGVARAAAAGRDVYAGLGHAAELPRAESGSSPTSSRPYSIRTSTADGVMAVGVIATFEHQANLVAGARLRHRPDQPHQHPISQLEAIPVLRHRIAPSR
jgi:hypothetical protein